MASASKEEGGLQKPAPAKKQGGSGSTVAKMAGLTIPPSRVVPGMVGEQRIGMTARVACAAVVERTASILLHNAAKLAMREGKMFILPRHISKIIRDDRELNAVFGDMLIGRPGVIEIRTPKHLRLRKTAAAAADTKKPLAPKPKPKAKPKHDV